ncbi:MAG: ATP-binding protein [Ferruginibacter sp.]|nr:ATP-binding protein [Ferruginibacter sp.]
MVQRSIFNNILSRIYEQKVTVLLGARRVGKTSLLKSILSDYKEKALWLNGEDIIAASMLQERSISNYKRLLNGYNLLIIDEAQYLEDIGRKVKLMIDEIHPLHIIITGSSAFDLIQESEPLVGRTITYNLYPIAQNELSATENLLQTRENLNERLIYGSYPEVINLNEPSKKEQYLFELANTYLLKDILAFENVRSPQKLKDLLVLIAHQIGKDVSLDELARALSISKNTVERYLDLLSKVFIIYKISGYSRNLRKEVSKSNRWYFYDNGVRNAVINNFSLLATRQDVGLLWENYIISERVKFNAYNNNYVNYYFWRTYDQQEIDLIEEKNNLIQAYEMKWKQNKTKVPIAFSKSYPEASFNKINQDNYLNFITELK